MTQNNIENNLFETVETVNTGATTPATQSFSQEVFAEAEKKSVGAITTGAIGGAKAAPLPQSFAGMKAESVKAEEFESKAAGEYPVKVDSLKFRQTEKGTKMATMTYKVISGDKYVGSLEFRPFFFNFDTKDALDSSIGKLAIAIMDATGIDKKKAIEQTLILLNNWEAQNFAEYPAPESWFADSIGILKISHYPYTRKDTGEKATGTNYKFRLQQR